MKVWLGRLGVALAALVLGLTFYNASWLADTPRGNVKLIAHRGAYQLYDTRGLAEDDCTATRIETPWHSYIENTVASLDQAKRHGAAMVELDIAPTADGQLAVFHDQTLDCRTDGTGPVRAMTLAELGELDAGFGYSADGGKTFPLRGKGVGAIPSLERFVETAGTKPLLFDFKGDDAREADLLAEKLEAMGRDVEGIGDSFYGEAAPIERIRALYPEAWAYTEAEARACTTGYLKTGWFGIVPEACENGTIAIPINRQWLFAGWPNKLIARMEEVGARVLVIGPHGGEDAPLGIDLPEQLGDIPASFNGWVMVDDIQAIGAALHPSLNRRRPMDDEALARTLAQRRARRE